MAIYKNPRNADVDTGNMAETDGSIWLAEIVTNRQAWFIYIEFLNEKLTASENGASSVVETVNQLDEKYPTSSMVAPPSGL